MPELTPELRAEYQQLFDSCIPRTSAYWEAAIESSVARIEKYKTRYLLVGSSLDVPWQWIGCIHMMESGGDFNTHLHNGDPLASRTTHAPIGRPKQGDPPFHWHTSALDALVMRGLHEERAWDIPVMLYEAERWNGFGYRNRHVRSPYLWAGSLHYEKGKYTKDFTWDPEATSKQVGVGLMLQRLQESGPINGVEQVTT
jgi:lysozyme family protein